MVRRCKNKNITQEFTRTVGRWIQSNRLRSCLCARARWVVVYSQLSAPQGHRANRDLWGLGPSQAGMLTKLLGP